MKTLFTSVLLVLITVTSALSSDFYFNKKTQQWENNYDGGYERTFIPNYSASDPYANVNKAANIDSSGRSVSISYMKNSEYRTHILLGVKASHKGWITCTLQDGKGSVTSINKHYVESSDKEFIFTYDLKARDASCYYSN